MSSCYYVSLGGQALGATHFLPLIITSLCAILASIEKEPLYFFIGKFWLLAHLVLWLAQHYFQIERPDPFCSIYHTYAYPSSEIYYSIAFVTCYITWTCYYKVIQPVMHWLVIFVFVFFPPVFLIYYSMNRWWEILWTVLFSIISNVIFMLLLIQGVGPNIDDIEKCGLLSWYGWKSRHFRNHQKGGGVELP